MNEFDWYQLAIIVFILGGIGVLVWRGGAANPVGTGTLQHDLKNVRAQVGAIGGKVRALEENAASKSNVHEVKTLLEQERKRIDKVFDSLNEIGGEVGALREAIGLRHAVIDALSESVRNLTTDLKSYQQDVNEKLGNLSNLVERIAASNKTVADLAERQIFIADQVARTESQLTATAKMVDRLYDFLTEKALK